MAEGQALNTNASPLLQKESAQRLLEVGQVTENRSTKPVDSQTDRPGHPVLDKKAEDLETKQQKERDNGQVSLIVKKDQEKSTGVA